MIFKPNWMMRGSKVLVICPPPLGTPPVICARVGVAPVPSGLRWWCPAFR